MKNNFKPVNKPPAEFKQNGRSKAFVEQAAALIEANTVKDYIQIATAIGFDKTSVSNVVQGRRNIPFEKYKKFTTLYSIPNHDQEGMDSSPKKEILATENGQDQKDLIIQLQSEIIKLQRDKSSEVERRLDEIEKDLTLVHSELIAGLQVVYESVQGLNKTPIGKPENTFRKKISEIDPKQK